MSNKYRSISVEKQLFPLLKDCEFIYRQHHPELEKIPLSKSKIIYEVIKFYLRKTEKEVLE